MTFSVGLRDRVAALAGAMALLIFVQVIPLDGVPDWVRMAGIGAPGVGAGAGGAERGAVEPGGGANAAGAGDRVFSFYVGNPIYYRSNVNLKRSDGTDLRLGGVGWDGDALHFPIDGGVRAVHWGQTFGYMIDYLHNKAIARLGRGAHGRRLTYPVIEEVPATGTFKGKPVPGRVRLTDIFDRLEFTHGHNMLFLTGMMRLASPYATVRPYIGAGAGVAMPHTEIWFKGETKAQRTHEYQLSGPAAQTVAGLEFNFGRLSYFVEYKFSYAWINGAITSEQSWKNWDVPGDLWRQFSRWWNGEKPKRGTFSTTLGAHQIVAGIGYRSAGAPKP